MMMLGFLLYDGSFVFEFYLNLLMKYWQKWGLTAFHRTLVQNSSPNSRKIETLLRKYLVHVYISLILCSFLPIIINTKYVCVCLYIFYLALLLLYYYYNFTFIHQRCEKRLKHSFLYKKTHKKISLHNN